MVILTQSEPVRRMVVSRLGKRHEVRGVHEREIMLWQPNSETAGDALVVVEFDDPPTKGGGATWQFRFDYILRDRWPDIAQVHPRLHELRSQL